MYENELAALARAGRLRGRKTFHVDQLDLAGNDYLGMAHNETVFHRAIARLEKAKVYGPKASQLVSGYHPIHRDFERWLIKTHGYEAALVIGSGFLGNLALFEALPRKGDLLLIDAQYHASGLLAAKTTQGRVEFFRHNDAEDLSEKLKIPAKRRFVAVEGVYSMSGRIVEKNVLLAAKNAGATLLLDEAHSSGVIGPNLLGVLEHYGLDNQNTVRMGTLGKAYGSYGAYLLSDKTTIAFLENRAKPVIYSTAPSLFDIAFAHESAKRIYAHRKSLAKRIAKAQAVAARYGFFTPSLILSIEVASDRAAVLLQKKLLTEGFLVGAIRRPTVEKPQLRVILREHPKKLEAFFSYMNRRLAFMLKS
ncbi:MAG: aminotransferase class I/II-fold pyridoxal phosphate-dependent enzyme [Campylobacterales bacterium]